MDPVTIAKLWLAIRPIKRWKERRKAKGEGMAIDLGTRTSTNALVGGTLFSQIYVQLVSLIPGEGALELFLLSPESVAFAAVLFAGIVARFSKTPAVPKVI